MRAQSSLESIVHDRVDLVSMSRILGLQHKGSVLVLTDENALSVALIASRVKFYALVTSVSIPSTVVDPTITNFTLLNLPPGKSIIDVVPVVGSKVRLLEATVMNEVSVVEDGKDLHVVNHQSEAVAIAGAIDVKGVLAG